MMDAKETIEKKYLPGRRWYKKSPGLKERGYLCRWSFALLILSVGLVLAPLCDLRARSRGLIEPLRHPGLAAQFYNIHRGQLFWMQPGADHAGKRHALVHCIDRADSFGLPPRLGQAQWLSRYLNQVPTDPQEALYADRRFTDAAISFCRDLYQGVAMEQWLSYDAISARYRQRDDSFILHSLAAVADEKDIGRLISQLEPRDSVYTLLKAELQDCRQSRDLHNTRQLVSSMNYYRWIMHFRLDSFIVVDIASATLRYYKRDSTVLLMKTVLGTSNRRTPRFAAYCTEVTLYPYWNMPKSIAVNEWLPAFRRSPGLPALLDMVVLDTKGREVDPATINWSALNKQHFPYRIRQRPGCTNPMGIIKFALSSPYAVYLHDTNFKGAFFSERRYYSHGCIRIHDPVGLANALLPEPVDTAYLRACLRDQHPKVHTLARPIPVFVVYMTAGVNDKGAVAYYNDVYRLLK